MTYFCGDSSFPMTMCWNKSRSRYARPGAAGFCLAVVLAVLLFLFARPSFPARADISVHFVGFREGTEDAPFPEGWELVSYPGKQGNRFILESRQEGEDLPPDITGSVLRVHSLNSVSALMVVPHMALDEYPVLSWWWKINRPVGMAREDRSGRNDSAARLRVVFGSPEAASPTSRPALPPGLGLLRRFLVGMDEGGRLEPPGRKIDYIWGNHLPAGTVIDYPGGRDHKVLVLQSGKEKAGTWVKEERDLLRDFREYFGGMPEGIAGILILSDTDETNEGVTAWFADVVLKERDN